MDGLCYVEVGCVDGFVVCMGLWFCGGDAFIPPTTLGGGGVR